MSESVYDKKQQQQQHLAYPVFSHLAGSTSVQTWVLYLEDRGPKRILFWLGVLILAQDGRLL